MSDGIQFDGYQKHLTSRLESFVDNNATAMKDSKYEDSGNTENNLLQMRQINKEMQQLALKMEALCRSSSEASTSGMTNYNIASKEYYRPKEAEQAFKKLSEK